MNLRDYMDRNKITADDMAKRLGASVHAVHKWYYGQRIPRPAQMRAIAAETFGAVTPADLVNAKREGNHAEKTKD